MIQSTKRRLFHAKLKLQETIRNILEINRKKKALANVKNAKEQRLAIQTKLKVLNKVAEQQAKLVRIYERSLPELEKRDTA